MSIDAKRYEGHTEGPWSYWPKCCREGGMITKDGYGQHIAAPTYYATAQETMVANATLMADAPLLLAECKRLEEDIHAKDIALVTLEAKTLKLKQALQRLLSVSNRTSREAYMGPEYSNELTPWQEADEALK